SDRTGSSTTMPSTPSSRIRPSRASNTCARSAGIRAGSRRSPPSPDVPGDDATRTGLARGVVQRLRGAARPPDRRPLAAVRLVLPRPRARSRPARDHGLRSASVPLAVTGRTSGRLFVALSACFLVGMVLRAHDTVDRITLLAWALFLATTYAIRAHVDRRDLGLVRIGATIPANLLAASLPLFAPAH